jgi:hypothetical protein
MFRILTALILISPPAQADVWGFATPSENIECRVGEGFEGSDISCTIFNRSGPAAVSQLAQCPLTRGITVAMLDHGYVEMSCTAASDKPLGAQSVADYGVTGEFGGFRCHSSTKGLECRNLDGHGFFLSRAIQLAF